MKIKKKSIIKTLIKKIETPTGGQRGREGGGTKSQNPHKRNTNYYYYYVNTRKIRYYLKSD